MKNNIEVILPKLGKSGSKHYVYYSCYNTMKDSYVRYRISKGFADLKSDKDIYEHADKIITELTHKLRSGWRPWKSDTYIYNDATLYHTDALINDGQQRQDKNQIRKYISAFIENKRLSVSAKSMESYISKLRIFVKWLEKSGHINLKVYQLNETIINEFIAFIIVTRKLDRLSVEKYQQNLNQFFKFCKSQKIITNIPSYNITKPPKYKDMAARPIADEDLVKILAQAAKIDLQFYLACMFQFFLCCRPGSELRLMKIKDINMCTQTVHIRSDTGKTGARNILMPDALVELCKTYKIMDYNAEYYVFGKEGHPSKTPLSINYFSYTFRKIRNKLHLSSNYKFYSLKHTAAGKLLESGATIVEVKNHLGHSDFESTIHYIKRHFGEKSEKVSNFRPEFLKGFI